MKRKFQDDKSYSSYKDKKTYSLYPNQVLQLIKEKKFSKFLEEFNGAENAILDMLGTFGKVEDDVYFSLLDCIFNKYGNKKTIFYIVQTACDQNRLETSNYLLNKLLGHEGKIYCPECLYAEETATLHDIVINALKYNSTINNLTIRTTAFNITYLTKNLLDTLVHNKTITTLNVDGYCGKNNEMIKGLQQALINSSVTSLNLNLCINIDWNRDKIIDDLANLLSSSNISKFKFTGTENIFSDSNDEVRVDDLDNDVLAVVKQVSKAITCLGDVGLKKHVDKEELKEAIKTYFSKQEIVKSFIQAKGGVVVIHDVVQARMSLSILGEETMACFDFLSAERPDEQLPDELVNLIAYHSCLLDIDSDVG